MIVRPLRPLSPFPWLLWLPFAATAHAQDVPGIENLHRRENHGAPDQFLQSNVDFLQKTITKLTLDHQQKIDSANRQIEGLKGAVVGLLKTVSDLQAAQKKTDEDLKKKGRCCAGKDAAPAAK